MATIQCVINKDAAGNASVTYQVVRLDPGDIMTFVSNTADTWIRCDGASPFGGIAEGDLRPVAKQDARGLDVTGPGREFSWACGEKPAGGPFQPWPGLG